MFKVKVPTIFFGTQGWTLFILVVLMKVWVISPTVITSKLPVREHHIFPQERAA